MALDFNVWDDFYLGISDYYTTPESNDAPKPAAFTQFIDEKIIISITPQIVKQESVVEVAPPPKKRKFTQEESLIRRRKSNAESQRKFRLKRKNEVKGLESNLKSLTCQIEEEQLQLAALRTTINALKMKSTGT